MNARFMAIVCFIASILLGLLWAFHAPVTWAQPGAFVALAAGLLLSLLP